MKNLNGKLNRLKEETKPDESWVASTRNEIFQEEESFVLFKDLDLSVAVPALAGVAVLVFAVIVGTHQPVPDYEMTENKVTPQVAMLANRLAEDTKGAAEMAAEENGDLTAEIDISNLSKDQQKMIVEKSTEELMKEVDELERRIERIMAAQNY